jgi:hypothetical protein
MRPNMLITHDENPTIPKSIIKPLQSSAQDAHLNLVHYTDHSADVDRVAGCFAAVQNHAHVAQWNLTPA